MIFCWPLNRLQPTRLKICGLSSKASYGDFELARRGGTCQRYSDRGRRYLIASTTGQSREYGKGSLKHSAASWTTSGTLWTALTSRPINTRRGESNLPKIKLSPRRGAAEPQSNHGEMINRCLPMLRGLIFCQPQSRMYLNAIGRHL